MNQSIKHIYLAEHAANCTTTTTTTKRKKLTTLQHRVRATNSHVQNGKNHFTRPS